MQDKRKPYPVLVVQATFRPPSYHFNVAHSQARCSLTFE
jgi:hypothetical protein